MARKRVPLAELQEHFEQLCEELRVGFAYHDEGLYGESYAMMNDVTGESWVCVPAIDSVAAYYVALHELGHTQQPKRMLAMTREYDAWAGAGDVSIVLPTNETRKRVAWAMLSYASSWADDKRIKIDQRFYDLLAYVMERRNA